VPITYSTIESGSMPQNVNVTSAPSTVPCGDSASAMAAMPTT